jgi:CheY-like chemotaxis protein
MMPNMTGIELFDRLQVIAPEQATRVIFLTGGVFTPQTQTRLEAAGNPQLQKPVTAQELRACVADIVDGPFAAPPPHRPGHRITGAPPLRAAEH